jgi:hypothetical protein
VVLGNRHHSIADAAMKLATWGREVDVGTVTKVATRLERLSASQAEFYFDAPAVGLAASDYGSDISDRRNFLWNQGWRARGRLLDLAEGAAGCARFARKAGMAKPLKKLCGDLDKLSGAQQEVGR